MKIKKAKKAVVSKAVKSYVEKKLSTESELKSYVNVQNITPLGAGTWNMFVMETIPQGVTVGQRVGETIKLSDIQIRGQIFSSTFATGAYTINNSSKIRMVIFRDKFGGSAATGAGTPSTSIMATNSSLSTINYETKNRYHIVFDKVFHLQQGPYNTVAYAAATMPTSEVHGLPQFHKVIRHKKGLEVDYLDTTGTLPSKNRYYMTYFVDQIATNQVIQISWDSRYLFRDP